MKSVNTAENLLNLLVESSWKRVLSLEFKKDYMDKIAKFLAAEKAKVYIRASS